MEDSEISSRLTGLEPSWLQPFDVGDPFHDGLRLEGHVSLKPDHRYGALAMLRVDGQRAEQLIYGTPKLHYPFGRDGVFSFPRIRSIAIFEKLDGTNVVAYRYHDSQGVFRTTYKLRLFPVLRNGRWGPFLDMWREMIANHPAIEQVASRNACSVSFELYGARNTHLVVYDKPLSVVLLFGIDHTGRPISPLALDTLDLSVPRLWGELTADHDPVSEYNRIRAELEKGMRHLDDGKLAGSEGTVWYVTRPTGELVLFKCKPESVESVHWAASINKEAVLATCWNVFETQDTLSYETLLPLLNEEYSLEDITAFRPHIDACILEVNQQLAFRNYVLDLYRSVGIALQQDKAAVMRDMSKHFGRRDMKKVHAIIAAHA